MRSFNKARIENPLFFKVKNHYGCLQGICRFEKHRRARVAKYLFISNSFVLFICTLGDALVHQVATLLAIDVVKIQFFIGEFHSAQCASEVLFYLRRVN